MANKQVRPFPSASTAHARPCATNVIVAAGSGIPPSHPGGSEVIRASTTGEAEGSVEIGAEEPDGLVEGVPEQAAPAIDRANSTRTPGAVPLNTHDDRTPAVKRGLAVRVVSEAQMPVQACDMDARSWASEGASPPVAMTVASA